MLNPQDDETVLHLRGPILRVVGVMDKAYLNLYAIYDENIEEKPIIIRIFETGQTIPYHFNHVDSVITGTKVFHVGSYREDDDAWTPALMNDDAAQSVQSSDELPS